LDGKARKHCILRIEKFSDTYVCFNYFLLAEYTEENPKIVTKCYHHYHLGCIYEWMERSENCPVCGKVMFTWYFLNDFLFSEFAQFIRD